MKKLIKVFWFGYESAKCPGCGSTNTRYLGNDHYACDDCDKIWAQ